MRAFFTKVILKALDAPLIILFNRGMMSEQLYICRRPLLQIGLAMLVSFSAPAWGPHEVITQAALDALGPNDALILQLGAQAQRLTNCVWMGDYFGVIMEEPTDLFYADDYLLFPGTTTYFDHTGPDVRNAFRPFYFRAVQALQTENPANAARWVGALLHFIQDAGCPPHAAGLRGDVHTKMETWIESDRVRIPGYPPREMGNTTDEVFDELLRRLGKLITDAEQKGRRLRISVEIGNQSVVRPVVLESALDCARLSADLLHALGPVARIGGAGRGSLRGNIVSQSPTGLERFPAKVMLEGTSYSTLADLSGQYEFRNLPASNYTVIAFRCGNFLGRSQVNVKPKQTNVCELTLSPDAKNLVPNGNFKLAWVRATSPDYWYQTKSGWEGEPILLKAGQKYRLVANYKPAGKSTILVRWMHSFEHALPRYKIEPRFQTKVLSPTERELSLIGSVDCGFLHLTVRGRANPATAFESISLEALPETK